MDHGFGQILYPLMSALQAWQDITECVYVLQVLELAQELSAALQAAGQIEVRLWPGTALQD